MKNRILCLALCLLLLVCFVGCAQKTKTQVSLFESFERTFPNFDLKSSADYMDVNDAKMTLYFANADQKGNVFYNPIVIYVSNSEKAISGHDREDQTVADYKSLEGYTVLTEYGASDMDGSLYAVKRAFTNLKYKYSEQITIPSEHLQGEQGTLYFYLCLVNEVGDEYMILTKKGIGNIRYEVRDGQVKFDFSDCESRIFPG
ncbi:MAG: hypothetical protein IIW17_06205 [Clostridia bacterium]|nr:hypothetical protein [Clostridia bacterium]